MSPRTGRVSPRPGPVSPRPGRVSPPRGRDRPGGTTGSILLLVVGFAAIALVLSVAVADASALFLAREDLATACDGAALAGAQSLDARTFYRSGAGTALPLAASGPHSVAATVAAYAAEDVPASWMLTATTNGTVVVVTGVRSVELPLFGRVVVRAQAQASALVGAG